MMNELMPSYTYTLVTPWKISSVKTGDGQVGRIKGNMITLHLYEDKLYGPITVVAREEVIPGGWITVGVVLVVLILLGIGVMAISRPKPKES